jgi:hypothetical protein
MEFIKQKSELIIDKSYKPDINLGLMDYFNRSLVFAQTNYQSEIDKLSRARFSKLTPTSFLDEYAWCVYCYGKNERNVCKFFSLILQVMHKKYEVFRDINTSINVDEFISELLSIYKNKSKANAIIKTILIVNNGIKLFNWEEYRDNFLNTPDKLTIFPYIDDTNMLYLAKNIGLVKKVFGGNHLNKLSERWGFSDPNALCKEIQKRFKLDILSIELILWYSAETFGTHICVK